MKQKILPLIVTLTVCGYLANTTSGGVAFSDNFNRPNSPTVGNGWLNATDNPPGTQLGINNNRLSAIPGTGDAWVYRPFPATNQIALTAVITDQNGFGCIPFRHTSSISIRNDGTINSGYQVGFSRGDQNYGSTINLFDNGVLVGSTNALIQFGHSLTVNYVVFNSDGSIQGRVTADGSSFDFSFPARAINSQGANILIRLGGGDSRCENPVPQTLDDFQILQAPNLTLQSTNRTPATNAIGKPTIPNDPNHFKVFTNGTFQSGIALDPNKMTVVLTHGWNGSPSDWAEYTAQIIQQRIGASAVNIIAWDWHTEASVPLSVATQFTLGEGYKLGTDLSVALGAGYTQKIHFIGHSLGTLVNAAAANYLHSHGFSPANTQMTLCDEAEIAWGTTSQEEALATFFTLLDNSSTSQPFWGNPLPRQFNWADNYISACGMLHPEAANVILTWLFPSSFPNFDTLKTEFYNFHDFAHYFYEDTIEPSIFNTGGQTNATYAGFICSFEGGGIANRPPPNTYFYQDPNGYELTLVQTNYGFATNFLNQRFRSYVGTVKSSGVDWAINAAGNLLLQANGVVQGAIDYTGNLIINLFTSGGSSSLSVYKRPMGGPVPNGGPSANNLPAYAWIPLFIPSNAISMTFDFMLQGDGASDSFQVALNSTNVLSLETMLIQTNVTLNSGMINVSAYAGQTNEFFVGIVGGTSTNAQITVQNLLFYSAPAPLLQAQPSGNDFVLTWPLSAADYTLQTSTNLTDSNSWTTVTNVPAIVDLQNTVTNPAADGARFYRLKK